MEKSKLWVEIENLDVSKHGVKRWEYTKRRVNIVEKMFPKYSEMAFGKLLEKMYKEEERSCNEIAEVIEKETGEKITARSIERNLKKAGVEIRKISAAFPLAIKRGRVRWAWRDVKSKQQEFRQVPSKLRYAILKRDGFKCVLCGSGVEKSVLEVDHKIARSKGGKNEETNLRTLCHECNMGKMREEKENEGGGRLESCKVGFTS